MLNIWLTVYGSELTGSLALVSLWSFAARRHMPSPTSHPDSSAQWKQLYEAAILELDSMKLPERIAVARRAILDRAEQVLTRPPDGERHALNNALSTLRLLEDVAVREKSAA
jgi:hypothetical protein